jgi:NDP-sugar pyrophosphorylase family protein
MTLCAVILAAGEGRRLRPLTASLPKSLCPVGNVPLLDRALAAVAGFGLTGPADVAVNAWYLADQISSFVAGRAHLSIETGPAPLGSAGGLGQLRDWIDGRDVLVGNADAYLAGGDLTPLLRDWSGATVRMLGVLAGDRPAEFGAHRFAGFSVLPWRYVASLAPVATDLVRAVWRPAEAAGELELVDYAGTYIDSGTPADYLAANLHALGSAPALVAASAVVTGSISRAVVGARATISGYAEDAVVWPDAVVAAPEHLVRAIRYGPSTDCTVAV